MWTSPVDSYFSKIQDTLAVFKHLIIPFICTYSFIHLYGNILKLMYLLLGVISQMFKNMPSDCSLNYSKTLISQ